MSRAWCLRSLWLCLFALFACSQYNGVLKSKSSSERRCARGDDDCDRDAAAADGGVSNVDADGSIATAEVMLPEPGGDNGSVIAEPDDEAAVLFAGEDVKTYEISVATEDLAKIDQQPSAEIYVPASVTIDGEHIDDIGMRYKGSAGAFITPCTASTTPGRSNGPKTGKCSIKLAFDYADDNQRFHGLRKLNLHAMGRDDSFMRERLGYAMYREMGVASPRTTYVRLSINGELEGLYLAVEEIDGRFTRSRFSEGGEGNLYKEVWPSYEKPATYRAALQSNKGDTTNVDKMLALAKTLKDDPDRALDWIDRDYTVRYIAVDRLLLNDDGVFHFYCFPSGNNPGPYGNHNYFWYESRQGGRMWLVPWDLDVSLGNPSSRNGWIDVEWSAVPTSCMCHVALGLPQRAPGCDPLVAEFGTLRDDYDSMVDAFVSGPFAKAAVDDKFEAWSDAIDSMVDEAAGLKGAPDRTHWQIGVRELRYVVEGSRDQRGFPYGMQ